MKNKKNMVIMGCGGVGANAAVMMARNGLYEDMILIDHDKVEYKNMERQPWGSSDVGRYKVDALESICRDIYPEGNITTFKEKITADNVEVMKNAIELIDINHVLVATDDLKTKKLVFNNNFDGYKVLVNCEKDYYEIKDNIDKDEEDAWEITHGYNTRQTWKSNLMAAIHYVDSIQNGYKVDSGKYGTKLN